MRITAVIRKGDNVKSLKQVKIRLEKKLAELEYLQQRYYRDTLSRGSFVKAERSLKAEIKTLLWVLDPGER